MPYGNATYQAKATGEEDRLMPFLETMLGYAATKGADAVSGELRGDRLTRKLYATVEAWKADLPSGARLEEPRALFAGERPPNWNWERPAVLRLHTTLEESVPNHKQWHAALVEQWHRVRQTVAEEKSQAFFRLPAADAEAHLLDLARRLVGTCAENERLFRRTVIKLLRRGQKKKGGALQLLTRQTHYEIPDSDGNRNVTKSPDGVRQDQYAYATFRISVVFEAFSGWNVHECNIFLFGDEEEWRPVSLFEPGQRDWPLTGRGVRKALRRRSEGAERQSPPTNPSELSVEPGRSVKTHWTGWVMTPSSLSREVYYDTLLTYHINTAYAAFLVRLHEIRDAALLGHRVFRRRGGFPLESIQRWSRAVVEKTPPRRAASPLGRVMLAGV